MNITAIKNSKKNHSSYTKNRNVNTKGPSMETIKNFDPQLFQIITQEENRQETTLNLIASENYVSKAVLQASATVLTNKYAEGYPGKRYYAGCELVDQAEQIAIERCKKLFDVEHANVQPHAGSQANMAVYLAALKPGDTIMGMSLSEGGHLTHGHPVNFSGTYFNRVQYKVNPLTELIDYKEIEKLAHQHKPKIIIAGASAYSRTIDFEKFANIAQSVGAYLMADIAHIAGFVATGLHPNPAKHADFITSTTHKTLRGPRGAIILSKQEHAEKIDRAVMPGSQGGPFMHAIAAKAVAFKQALQPEFKMYQQQTIKNAQYFAKTLQKLDYRIVAGGTDNHLFIVDLRSKNINGTQASHALAKAGITVSKSCIPFDPTSPWITSGIRLGTPALTTRGMQEKNIETVAHLIDEVVHNYDNETALKNIKEKVKQLCLQFPINL